ncbi:hypothetical protein N7499_000480 [Penicillium canescens]|uniref:Uncharacterized protein n=1 Tax=Penicillium canescens TaxID=5083 RepID=A0AAD6NB58_PENCN|nr:uncharacterized protein N7446_011317 [Penicillium canescens]KAJ6029334.1 hypothetical protein N7444_012321 [Penicillium canescens]KAJ6047765.1 hypothetical protein N7460_003912 [Penicillium canescens]KAJ6048634.1 hypothetical protein N7446_011317 [Penicillium canescens]KAJ6100850.1 hypothetical protein N7499_000480 [Penicillium canescens]KAJ6173310.1 hypothetical protein N7485_006122 [Penicillium canescens]
MKNAAFEVCITSTNTFQYGAECGELYSVIETFTAWLGDIDTVNLFPERAPGLDTNDFKFEAQIALTLADG